MPVAPEPQSVQPWASSLHSKPELSSAGGDEYSKFAVVVFEVPVGVALSSVVPGAVVSIVHVSETVGLTFPARSVARTSSVCDPSPRLL